MSEDRKLAAIMFTDIVGYSALMSKDADKALELLRTNREIQKPLIEKYDGKWLKEMGDGILARFDSAIDSVRCAIEIQKSARKKLKGQIRIGIHLGDVTTENGDVFGDGVNIASRLQAIADPGGIYISDSIEHAIRGSTDIHSEFLGAIQLKNIDYLVDTYFIVGKRLPVPSKNKKRELSGIKHKSIFKSIYTYIVAILIFVITITAGLWIKNVTRNVIKAIAVLPVENIYNNEDQEWLTAGIHNGLIDELSKISAIRVISRISSMKYLNTNMTIPEIARELKVNGIITASYYTNEDDVNIQVRLIKGLPKERQIWGQAYNRSMQNVLSIYNDVAKSIADEADINLSPTEEIYLSGTRQVNPKAYEAYLRGMSHVENATKADLDKALDYFKLACEIDPEYALAYGGISLVWRSYTQHGYKSMSESEPIFKEADRKALELDSTIVQILGWDAIFTAHFGDWEDAVRKFRKVLDINPNFAMVHVYYGHYALIKDHPVEGLEHSYLASKLDPFNDLVQSVHAMNLKNARKYDEALELIQESLKTNPDHGIHLPALWAVYHEKGDYTEALEIAKKIYLRNGNELALEALEVGFEEGGYKMAMQRIAEAMIALRDTTFFPTWQIFTLYCRSGLKQEALDWLEMAFEEDDPNILVISVDPLFDFLRDEPRFKDMLQKNNLPEIQFPLK
jgi:class 3 adenylate cyclase/TolB-like protein/Tfp pilus assembly protein PilF